MKKATTSQRHQSSPKAVSALPHPQSAFNALQVDEQIDEQVHDQPFNLSPDSIAKCPIRMLDDHSPAEVAKYFEAHKHEIPRSHEICVKRYQNEESIKKIDAKYRDPADMLQGLGIKHQTLLPTKPDVLKWTNDVSSDPPTPITTRENYFDRPMPSIRLGESPNGVRVLHQE